MLIQTALCVHRPERVFNRKESCSSTFYRTYHLYRTTSLAGTWKDYTPDDKSVDLNEIMLPEALYSLGYVTASIGKWHVGDEENISYSSGV